MDDPDNRTQAEFWESEAARWIEWARTPGHDAYWDYSPAFFEDVVVAPGRRTLEIGCGEGRVTRDLKRRGHNSYAIDTAPTLVAAAADADHATDGRYLLADGARLPFRERSFDLVVAYNSLMDVDDMPTVVREAARVLEPHGRFCICITHPMVDVGAFEDRSADARFVINGDYLATTTFDQTFERSGLVIRFRSLTHSIEAYFRALEDAGLVVERLREPRQRDEAVEADPAERRWQRMPNFLFIRARKPSARVVS